MTEPHDIVEEDELKTKKRKPWLAERMLLRPFLWLLSLAITGMVIGALIILAVFYHFSKDLPDSSSLANYQPAGMTRLYSREGVLMAEYAKEQRIFIPFEDIPRKVINAFIAAEDKDFYSHQGIDPEGIMRAFLKNMQSMSKGERSLVGGSTITQQVVKNFLLTSEKSYERKIKEAILALRITQNYSKDRILELYLNEIYLGMGAYGVAAAAQEYFGKDLDALATEEIAVLAGMPKAPSYYDPRKRPEEAKERRDYVLKRMVEDGYINQAEYERGVAAPLSVQRDSAADRTKAPFFSEEVRRWLLKTYGADKLYKGSLYVRTTADLETQALLDEALRDALVLYDKRHGFRGALTTLDSDDENWQEALYRREQETPLRKEQKLAIVKELRPKEVIISFVTPVDQLPLIKNGNTNIKEHQQEQDISDNEIEKETDGLDLVEEVGSIALKDMLWARPVRPSGAIGPVPAKPADILHTGDVIIVEMLPDESTAFALAQIPKVSGAMIAMQPQTGEILAMSGGYSYMNSEFNRATQAKRQPGSSFKPFVYLAALERGFTPSTIIDDSPVEISQGPGKPMWRPKNYGGDFLGPTTLRTGLEKSRNVMTVRLAQMIGIKAVAHVAERLGIYDDLPAEYSSVLGAHETTVLRLATAYSMIVNGGLKIDPIMIKRVDNRKGNTIYRADARTCEECRYTENSGRISRKYPPDVIDERERVIDPRIAYQMVSLLQGVVERGTATSAKKLGFRIAGKTGTTNESRDAWFIGFSQDLVVATYIGFDTPAGLGAKETGGRVALPAFIQFMEKHYAEAPPPEFIRPSGIIEVAVDKYTGVPPMPWQQTQGNSMITEIFVTGGSIFIPGEDIVAQEANDPQSASSSYNTNNPTASDPAANNSGYYIDPYGIERQQPSYNSGQTAPQSLPYSPYAGQQANPKGNVPDGYTPIMPSTPALEPQVTETPATKNNRAQPYRSNDFLPPGHPSRIQERRQRAYEMRNRPQRQENPAGKAGSGTGGLY